MSDRGDSKLSLSSAGSMSLEHKSVGKVLKDKDSATFNLPSSKPCLKVAILGPHTCGKTTLLKHILKRTAPRYDREFRPRDGARAELKIHHLNPLVTANHRLVFIDTTGHPNYVGNLCRGIAQADAAILLVPLSIARQAAVNAEKKTCVDAPEDADKAALALFEAQDKKIRAQWSHTEPNVGVTPLPTRHTQLFQHAVLAYTFGIRRLIVCINKLHTAKEDELKERFETGVAAVKLMLTKIGFKPENLQFLPLGFTNDTYVNIHETASFKWFDGPWLMKAIDEIPAISPEKLEELARKPLRVAITHVYKIGGIGTVVFGCVKSGVIRTGQQLGFAGGESGPVSLFATSAGYAYINDRCDDKKLKAKASIEGGVVRSLEVHREPVTSAGPGEFVGINVNNISVRELRAGMIAGLAIDEVRPRPTKEISAEIVLFKDPAYKSQYAQGSEFIAHAHAAQFTVKIERIVEKVQRSRQAKDGAILFNGDAALVTFKILHHPAVCLESYNEFPSLGRFALRDGLFVVGAGAVSPSYPFRSKFRAIFLECTPLPYWVADLVAKYCGAILGDAAAKP